jgi:diguanylate cyclase (GGDEF)-like protein
LVVVENKRPVGLLMSHSLDRQLGTLYGTALYYDREVSLVMDPHPLIVESSTPVEAVAAKSTTRDRFKLYDHIIVTSNQAALGVVSVQKMLDALARVQVEMAKGANPLTGLPGGVALEQEIERCCALNLPFSLIYVDLDNFKIFNDGYGFEAGDKMLRLMADILQWACRRHGMGQAFVGHIGGDDFVVITTPDRADRLCTAVVRCFKRLVRGIYRTRDIKRGYVLAKGRDGHLDQFPLVSVSLGIVDCVGKGCDLALIAKRAAEVKRFAKSKPGHIFVHDRRLPLGLE